MSSARRLAVRMRPDLEFRRPRYQGRGRAKIHAGQQTLGERFYRYLCQTFRFER